jgi:predicted dehydrogenase
MGAYKVAEAVPPNLAWDLWLGAAKPIAYRKGLHDFKWRGYYAFGCGALGDMAAHVLNPANYILELGLPAKIEVEVPARSDVAFPIRSRIVFHFPATAKRGPIELTWLDGVSKDKQPFDGAGLNDASGSYFTASECSFAAGESGSPINTFPQEKYKVFLEKNVPQKYERIKGGHYQNWIDSIRQGKKAVSDFSYAGPFSEIMLLGVIAQRLGRTLEWDAKAGEFKNDNEANALVKAPSPTPGFLA